MKRLLILSLFFSFIACSPSPRYSTLQSGGSGRNNATYKKSTPKNKKSKKKSSTKGHHDLRGVASWYGPGFHGKTTANGERFNKRAMTAAHKTLPFNTVVEVTCDATGKKVKVRINDRGPYAKGRIIDLSEKAAERIGVKSMGHAPVKLRIIK